MQKVVIKALEEWADESLLSEKEIIRAAHQIFPSWKLTSEIKYGPFQKNGWQQNVIQLYKGKEIIQIHFWNYNGWYDKR